MTLLPLAGLKRSVVEADRAACHHEKEHIRDIAIGCGYLLEVRHV